MITLFGWRIFAALIVVLTVVCGAVSFKFNGADNLLEFLGLFSKVGFVLSVALVVLGQTHIFPWLCKLWPLNSLVPDIHGTWSGDISSNWPIIAEACGIKSKDGTPFQERQTPVTVDICVRLLSVSIELKSDTGYQSSRTLSCNLQRNSHRGYELSYVYRSSVPDPNETDEQAFYGAGIIDFDSRKPTELNGVYWTNRNWQKGLNPAGVIRLIRA